MKSTPGIDVIIFEICSPKKMVKILPSVFLYKILVFFLILDHSFFYEKRQLAKIAENRDHLIDSRWWRASAGACPSAS
jgi:hypothetical protein